jgi:methyl-accepting chemotaxis protein
MMGPGLALMYRISNKGKMPLTSALYLIPLAVLYYETGAQASTFTRVTIVLFVSVAIYLMFAWYLQARDGFQGLGKVIDRIAEGNLTSSGGQQMGGAFQKLMASLSHVHSSLGGIVANVRATANEVAQSAAEIAAANSHLSQRTEQQAATLAQTAAGMEELARTVAQNAGTASGRPRSRSARRTWHSRARTRFTAWSSAWRRSMAAPGAWPTSSARSRASRSRPTSSRSMRGRGRARGEQGRGFAVVAAEVRSLAQRSGASRARDQGLIAQSVPRSARARQAATEPAR